ncbi:MAG TPA: hypothetical protein PKZ24_09825 [Nitrospirales bacterium]|nr:hypothetical protein [Nitrospirales bacterium]
MTKYVTQAVFFYAVGCSAVLGVGLSQGAWAGLFVGLLAVVFGLIVETMWLFKQAFPIYREIR